MHGHHVSHIDKCCRRWITATRITEIPTHHTHTHIYFLPPFAIPTTSNCNFRVHGLHLPQSSCHLTVKTTRGPSSNVTPSPAPPIVIFELNQARRAKVTDELEAVRSGIVILNVRNWGSTKCSPHAHYRRLTTYRIPRVANRGGVRRVCREEG
jgi:hypothetical protein